MIDAAPDAPDPNAAPQGVAPVSAAEVDALLLREQFMRLDRSLLAPLGLLLLVALAHSGSARPELAALWVGIMFALFFWRRGHARAALRGPLTDTLRDYRRRYWTEFAGAVVIAAAFSSCMWLLGSGQGDAMLGLRLVFLAGTAAVSFTLIGLHPRIYGAFLLVLMGVLAAYLVIEMPQFFGGRVPSVVIVALFAWLLHSRSRDEHRQAREGILARLNQNHLVQRLRETLAEQQAVRANLELKSAELERTNQKLGELAIHDALTGAFNRGHAQELLRQGVARFARYRQSLCVLLIDIDHFKSVNDRYGHAVGDEVLRQMTGAALASLREGDLFGRWGGEEFIALLPNIGLVGAVEAAERLSAAIKALSVLSQAGDGAQIRVTVSIGVAEIQDGESAEALVARADAALYAAKDAGRDRVMLSGGAGEAPGGSDGAGGSGAAVPATGAAPA